MSSDSTLLKKVGLRNNCPARYSRGIILNVHSPFVRVFGRVMNNLITNNDLPKHCLRKNDIFHSKYLMKPGKC